MIHTIIAVERRSPPRELATVIDASTYDAKGKVLTTATQLHSMGEKITDPSNILYAAEWDMVSPFVVVTIGKLADIKLSFLGWPMTDVVPKP